VPKFYLLPVVAVYIRNLVSTLTLQHTNFNNIKSSFSLSRSRSIIIILDIFIIIKITQKISPVRLFHSDFTADIKESPCSIRYSLRKQIFLFCWGLFISDVNYSDILLPEEVTRGSPIVLIPLVF